MTAHGENGTGASAARREAEAAGAVRITDTDASGRGVGRMDDGLAVFVPGLIPGDLAFVTIERMKRRFAVASLKRLIEPSPNRVAPLCAQFSRCGGCSLQHMRYPEQARMKERLVETALVRIGGVRAPVIRPIVAMENPWRYRNKARYAVEGARVGFYAAESHALADAPDCLIQAPPANALAGVLRRFAAASRRADRTADLVRGLTVRTAFGTGEVMAVLSVSESRPRGAGSLLAAMGEAVSALPPGENGATYSLESVVFVPPDAGVRPVLAAGKGTISERLGELHFDISPHAFFQVNPAGARALWDPVTKYADLRRRDTVFDLYCGAGVLGLRCAGAAGRVVGVESDASAVADARRNAARNGIANAVFVRDLAERALPALLARERPRTVILDPPRAGCRAELLSAIAAGAPARIVYVSCDPATLARDVKRLTAAGYAFVEATPVDMFPHTGHVECVVSLHHSDRRV
ncbi:MAG: 23S rRNA (uracil(1939)-C(5))-methyltransferase RlmD [Clostridiales Family XIII bacterium]|jgi:23S rRNA (uracil1939-C5)-methyltransferase|nr:23S rRNA (uracil(1939)-C(5))-methyltransferase RlmD [Clostridiales Family XIII bacterium]